MGVKVGLFVGSDAGCAVPGLGALVVMGGVG